MTTRYEQEMYINIHATRKALERIAHDFGILVMHLTTPPGPAVDEKQCPVCGWSECECPQR